MLMKDFTNSHLFQLIKNPRIAASADDLSDYLETSRDFPNENIVSL